MACIDIVELVERLNNKFAERRMRTPKDQTWPTLTVVRHEGLPPVVMFNEFGLLGGEDDIPSSEAACVNIICEELRRISGAIANFVTIISAGAAEKSRSR